MKSKLGLLLAIGIFVIQAVLVPGTGMTWDEPSSFFFGRANLKFWLTGDRRYVVDFKNKDLFKNDPIQYIYGEDVYPPFPFVVSSAFSYVLSERLHLLNFIDAHHLGEVAIGAIGVGFFYYLAIEIGFTPWVAFATTLIYALSPVIFGQMRADAKDIPLMSLLVISMYWFVRWVKNESWYGLLFVLSFGLALATKPSAAILVPILLVWLFIKKRTFILKFLVLSSLSVVVMIAVWPWLWDDPVGKLTTVWQFFRTVGYRMPVLYLGKLYSAGIDLPKEYPFAILLFQMPIEITLFFLLGTIIAFKKPWGFLVLIWFWLGMSRFFVPGVLIYSRVRHFIDVIPAFFLLVGFGLQFIRSIRSMRVLLIFFILSHEFLIISRLYPYEPGYYNFLVGGVKTAAEKQLFDVDYWGNGATEAMQFINTNKPDARVYACGLWHLAYFYKKGNVRVVRQGDSATHTIVPNSPSWFGGALDFYKKHDRIVFTVARDGADLFYVFERTTPAFWNCGYETEANY